MKKALLSLAALAGTAHATPISQRIVKYEIQGDDVIATVATGSENGVERDMTCRVFEDDKAIGSRCVIIRVDKRTSVLKTDLSRATLDHHGMLTVRFERAKK